MSVLGIDQKTLSPNRLIQEILKAPVDLLWNGGIGTYVKADSEKNSEVGDFANNLCRVNADQLRCKVVSERLRFNSAGSNSVCSAWWCH